ncbi:unnamed protein product [Albugo candida]|uniref:Uncharacterized protein n=1 Tax=Albugo candida TaxID=65357 RepID=A0A024FUX4_9STRA|nr:unnamed protein product [Albugo candida]|eukprot:CCI10846.1 unnamed protein product [Albugo candida]
MTSRKCPISLVKPAMKAFRSIYGSQLGDTSHFSNRCRHLQDEIRRTFPDEFGCNLTHREYNRHHEAMFLEDFLRAHFKCDTCAQSKLTTKAADSLRNTNKVEQFLEI